MHHYSWLPVVCLVALLAFPAAALALDASKEADIIYKAMTESRQIPISSVPEAEQTMDNAYLVQAELMKKLAVGETIIGYKGGVTAQAQFARFKAESPTTAPIFKSGVIFVDDPQETLVIKAFPGIMLETEFVYKIAAPIKAPVKDVDSLKKLVASVHAGIEIPCLNFEDMSRLFIYDLTAAGVGTKMYLIGPPHDAQDLHLDAMEVTLTLDGEEVNRGVGSDALGGQWDALLWLVNEIVKRHGGLDEGQYVFTGALGKMIPGKPGTYTATYPINTLHFKIEQ